MSSGKGGGGGEGSAASGSNIVSLVQQLKAGKMSKEELFDQLSRIQREKKSGGGERRGGAAGSESSSASSSMRVQKQDPQSASPDKTRSHVEGSPSRPPRDVITGFKQPSEDADTVDEDAILARAREAYRRRQAEQQQRSEALGMQESTKLAVDVSSPSPEANRPMSARSARSDANSTGGLSGGARRVARETNHRRMGSPAGTKARPASAHGDRRHSGVGFMGPCLAGQPVKAEGRPLWGSASGTPLHGQGAPERGGARGSNNTSFDEFRFETARRGMTEKAEQRKEEIKKELDATCPFKPTLYHSQSADYVRQSHGGSSDIYARQMAWRQQREEEVERKRIEGVQEQARECTFTPVVNRSGDTSLRHEGATRSAEGVAERLYSQGLEHRRHVQDVLKAKQQEEENKACTFKPAVNPTGRRDPTPVKSRYLDSTPRKSKGADVDSGQRREEEELKECTFTPRVNRPSRDMAVARQYLSEPAWERLSKPRLVTPQQSTDSCFSSTQRGASPARTRGMSPGPHGRRPETPSWGGDSSRRLNDSIGRESSASSFDAFLQRQEDFVRKQDMNVQLMRSEVSGQAKPIISANSERIMRRKEKEDAVVSRPFLERVEHTIELKNANMSELSDRVHEECTFKPKINKMSHSMPTRSWRELSEGDTKRLHQVHQGLKQERDGYENEIFTFKPKINASPGVQSRLKVSSDPHNYVQRLEHENKMQQRQQLMRSQEVLEREMKECTFRPKVNEVPSFVRTISAAQKKMKESSGVNTQSSSESSKKGWNASVSVDIGHPKRRPVIVRNS